MKVALVYDRVNKWGGAERVLLALHKIFPKAPLYTSVYDKKNAPWAKVFDVRTSFLQRIPFAKRHHEWYASLMPIAFEGFDFDPYDVVISVTSEAAKGIVTKPKTRHICICLTPTRYLWSGYENYFSNKILKTLAGPIISLLRKWDFAAAQRPDIYVAISEEVARRLKKYYKKTSHIIYPPIELRKKPGIQKEANDYLLVVSRLVAYKRIDIAIETCNQLHLPLKIIGVGSQEQALREIAGPTIEFLGSVSDDELETYYRNSTALLFPGLEDFGLTVLEAQQFGKPVIAYKAGGALETIIEGKTGEFFSPQTTRALVKKLQLLLKSRKISIGRKIRSTYAKAGIKHARKFDQKKFRRNIIALVKSQGE